MPEASPFTITSPPQHPSEQSQSATATVPSSGAQPTFAREEVEKKVLQRLKDQSLTGITHSEFTKAVDSAMRSLGAEALAREERATSVPPPYSSLNHTLDSRSQMLSAERDLDADMIDADMADPDMVDPDMIDAE